MQADGSSHFTLLHHRAPSLQLLKDIECCSRAWSEGVRLLRVHHEKIEKWILREAGVEFDAKAAAPVLRVVTAV